MTPANIATLLEPYLHQPLDLAIAAQLSVYLELILKWNAKTNLTSVRRPEVIVQRHFGESIFTGAHLGPCQSLLDFGSGAGFPGIPIQLIRPDVAVTLAESQNKKSGFLREVVRTLDLPTEVWADRVDSMPKTRCFDAVALRAVDKMESSVYEAGRRAAHQVLILSTTQSSYSALLSADFALSARIPLPQTQDGLLEVLGRRTAVVSSQ